MKSKAPSNCRLTQTSVTEVATTVRPFALAQGGLALAEKRPGEVEQYMAYSRHSEAEKALTALHERRLFMDAVIVEVQR